MAVLGNGVFAGAIQSNLSSALAGLATQDGGGMPRVPFVFSSVKRDLAFNSQVETARGELVRLGAIDSAALFNQNTLDGPYGTSSVNQILTLNGLDANALRGPVAMAVNPASVRFEMAKRITKIDTLAGSRFCHFTTRLGFDNDIMTISMSGSTGTITRPSLAGGDPAFIRAAAMRHAAFLNLYALTCEESYLPELNVDNTKSLTIASNALPIPVTFYGHFESTLNYEESANKPNSLDYSLKFVVERIDSLVSSDTSNNFIQLLYSAVGMITALPGTTTV